MDKTDTVGHRILVPLDGSPVAAQALPAVRAVADPKGEVLLLLVVPDRDTFDGGRTSEITFSNEDVLRAEEDVARQLLATAADTLRAAISTLHVEIVVAAGDPTETILRVADERAVDLIVLASHGRGALGRWAFGSVADRVSRSAAVPILIVRAQKIQPRTTPSAALRRLVVPLDGSELATRALPVAKSLAERLTLPVLLLSVVDPRWTMAPALAATVATAAYDVDLYNEIRAELRAKATKLLESSSESLERDGVTVTWQIVDGSPAAAILDLAEPSDLVILTSHGRSGVRRWLLGSVAEKLIRAGLGPVLLVRSKEESAVSPDDGQPTE